jgi:hypothetical protein
MLLPAVTQLISLVQLLRVPWPQLTPKGRRHYIIALCSDVLVISAAAYWIAHRF